MEDKKLNDILSDIPDKNERIIVFDTETTGINPLYNNIIEIGAIEILDYLKKRNIKIALATSATKERMFMQIRSAKIEDKFDALVCREDVKNLKPDPEIFLLAAKKLNVKPEECIVIEDSEAGIKAAYNGKMIGFHVEDLKKADNDILKYCKKSFKNLVEIKEYINKDKIKNS